MDLSAISPATRTVALGRAAVEVSGLSLRSLTGLIAAYPDLVGLAVGGHVSLSLLVRNGPEMGLAIFSLGVVGPARPRFWRRWQAINEDDMLSAFEQAATGQQLDALADIVELTFRGERGLPFLRGVLGALAKPAAAQGEKQDETPANPSPTSSSD